MILLPQRDQVRVRNHVQIPFGAIFRPEIAGKQANFPNELLRLGRGGDRRRDFSFLRAGELIERVGGQFGVISINFHGQVLG